MVRHAGGLPGFLTRIAFFPHDGVALAAVINAANSIAPIDVATFRTADVAFGYPFPIEDELPYVIGSHFWGEEILISISVGPCKA